MCYEECVSAGMKEGKGGRKDYENDFIVFTALIRLFQYFARFGDVRSLHVSNDRRIPPRATVLSAVGILIIVITIVIAVRSSPLTVVALVMLWLFHAVVVGRTSSKGCNKCRFLSLKRTSKHTSS